MSKFGYLIHPLSIAQLKEFWPMVRIIPDFIIKSSLKSIRPVTLTQIKSIESIRHVQAQGYFILCPLLPEEILDENGENSCERVADLWNLIARLEIDVLGLGGYLSCLPEVVFNSEARGRVPITSGNTLSAWTVFEGVYQLSRQLKKPLADSTLAILDPTTPIGSLCFRKFSEQFKRIIVYSTYSDKLTRLIEQVRSVHPVDVIISEDFKDAEYVILTTSLREGVFQQKNLKPGATVFDISVDRSFARNIEKRLDVRFIESGLIKLPVSVNLGIDFGLPTDVVYSSLAEVVLLTLENRFVNYSVGDSINMDKMEEIADISARHGFQVWLPEIS